jgi:predicted ATPase
MTIHLRALALKRKPPLPDSFPFNVPLIRSLTTLDFPTPITFLVGENGSGKSTLLEAIAAAAKSITVGTQDAHHDTTLAEVRRLADRLALTWAKNPHRGFFMRSEDFFGYARRISQMRAELKADLDQVEEDYKDRSEYAKGLARMAYSRELHALQQSYGEGLDVNSHGESFFKLFRARFVPGGLYLLDEPEAPLSPMRQLALLAMLKEMLGLDAQFIIATHSPILLAYPGATIYSCDGGTIHPAAYDDLEHVNVTRDFLLNPATYLKHLLD